MKNIDKRIVELGFENKGFEEGIKTSQGSLKEFDNSLKKVATGSAFSALGKSVGNVGTQFSALGTIATGALLTIGNQAFMTGQQLVKSLSLDQIMAGFNEYELKINSIKVMLAGGRTKEGLPVTLQMVNDELRKLNEYSDQTIYSFSDMTRNIGKFTNAGVDLETAVQSIKGISNVAALSGANSEEAARAMYNFAQALSAGYVKFIDWKSIENANMATVDFKNQLMESAVAAGTLEKRADGMYNVLSGDGMDEPISATKMFNQSLETQWMTAEVLNTTLGRYSDVTTEIGAKATEAATKVRTFKQLMDTTKEAIGSGWAMTFEHIIGDYDEATTLWSGVSNALGDVIKSSSDARNNLLKDWNELGGRKKIISGLSIAWKNLGSVVGVIKDAFTNVFPPITAEILVKISKAFKKLMVALTPSTKVLSSIKTIFEGIFNALYFGFKIFVSVFDGIFDGVKAVLSIIPSGKNGGILGFFTNLAKSLTNLHKAATKAEVFAKISKSISTGITFIGTKAVKIFGTTIKDISNWIAILTEKIKTFFGNMPKIDISGITKPFEKIREIFNKPLIKDADKVSSNTKKVSDSLSSLSKTLKPVQETFSKAWDTVGFSGLIDIFKALVTGGVGIAIIKFFKSITGLSNTTGKAISSLGGLSGVFGELGNTLKAYQSSLKSKQLKEIAIAIGILVASLAVLTFLDEKKMLAGVGVITVLFANLSASMIMLKKFGGGVKTSMQMLVLATSILILSGALMMLKNVDPNSIYAVSAIIGELVLANILLSKVGKSSKGTANLIGMAMAVNLIAIAVKIFGKMDPDELKQGIIAISILMGEMLLFSVIIGNFGGKAGSMLAAGIAMGLIAIALLELVGVVAILAQFAPEKLLVGLGGLAAILGMVSISMLTMANPKVIFGAAAMIILAAAITLFVPAIITLGSLPVKTITQGLLAIAGLFAILGVAGLVLGPILPTILGVSAAIMLLGAAMLAAGTGMMLFGTGLALVAASGAGAIAVLILAITSIVALIPFILTKVGQGLVALAVVIGESAPVLMTAVGSLITAFLNLVVEKVPEIVNSGMTLILGFLQGITDNIQPIIETIIEMITNILDGISSKLPELITAGADLIIAFLDGMGTEIPRVIDAGFKMIIDFINGLADSIRENTPLLLDAIKNLATAFTDGLKEYFNIEEGKGIMRALIDGLVNGVDTGIDLVLKSVTDLGTKVLDAIKGILGIASPSKEAKAIGEYIDMGLVQGLKNRSRNVVNAAKEVGENSINALQSTMNKISNAVDSEINSSPVITPVLNLNELKNNANNLNRLLSSGQSYNLASSKINDDKVLIQTNQNGSSLASDKSQIINQFNLNGITIRSDADIDKLATELYRKQENAMRSRGIRPAYSN